MKKLAIITFATFFCFSCDSFVSPEQTLEANMYPGFLSYSKLDTELVQRIEIVCPGIHGDEYDIILPHIREIGAKSTAHLGPCSKNYTGQQVIVFKRIGPSCREALYNIWVCFMPGCDEAGLTFVKTIKLYNGPCPY